MSQLIAMAIPIVPGKENEWQQFVNELRTTRRNDFERSRQQAHVRERTFLQKTPEGNMCVVTLEGEDPKAAFKQFTSKNEEFTKWFLGRVKELHNVDLAQLPSDAFPEMLVDTGKIEELALA